MKKGGEGHETGIVPMDPEDAASMARISALHARCFSTSGAEGASPREAGGSGGWSGQDFSRVLASPGSFGFVAGGFIVGDAAAGAEQKTTGETPSPTGFVLCRVAGEDCEVLTFGVDPQACGAGLGGRLLEVTMIRARAGGATRMVLEVAGGNDTAWGLYEGMGFQEIGRRDAYYSHCSPKAETDTAGTGPRPQREWVNAWVLARDVS